MQARERQQIQRWTAQLLPPELVGSHIGAERAHTTGRKLDLSFRAATAMFGHLGVEWDLTEATPAERRELASWIELYKQHRALIHTGRVVRRSLEDDALWLHGAIAPDAIVRTIQYAHPVFTQRGMAAQARVEEISGGRGRTHFAGAYWGWGFHEDGVVSGLRVARELGVRPE